MDSSTFSSEQIRETMPAGLHLTAADRPGVAQPVPERDVPPQPWRPMGLIVLCLLVILTSAWEWKMRSLELVPGDLGYNFHRWADLRRQIDQRNVPVAIVGDSRITFDTDLDRATELIGFRPLQLGLAGISGLPMLESLADDVHFKGLAIVGTNEVLYFSPNSRRAQEALDAYHWESPAKRGSYLVQRAISPYLAMLDDDYQFSAILFRSAPDWRAGVSGPRDDLGKFQETGQDGQTWLWRRIEHDKKMAHFIQDIWDTFMPPKPLEAAQIQPILIRTKAAVDTIRARGGDVVFVRPPSGPHIRPLEDKDLPKAKGWDALLSYANVRGIHIDDLPAAQNLTLPEDSHLTRACAKVFTDAYVRALARDTPLLHLRPDAPAPLTTSDCVR